MDMGTTIHGRAFERQIEWITSSISEGKRFTGKELGWWCDILQILKRRHCVKIGTIASPITLLRDYLILLNKQGGTL